MGFFKDLLGGGDTGTGTAREAMAKANELAPGIRFNPWTVRTSTGTTAYDPATGGYRSELSSPFQQYLTQATGGAQGFLSQLSQFDPRQRTQQIVEQNAALLDPLFAQQRAKQAGQSFMSGRLGLRLAGEGVGAGEGSGMVNPDFFGLNVAQSQALAGLVPQASQQAYNEMGQLAQMGTGLMSSAMGVSGLEQQLLSLGVDAETARSAANTAAANVVMQPYGMMQQAQAAKAGNRASMGAGIIKGAATAFSDMRLKANITHVDTLPNGIKLYTWEWNNATIQEPTFGVLAQEVLETIPEAVVVHDSGYLMVDYSHPELKGVH